MILVGEICRCVQPVWSISGVAEVQSPVLGQERWQELIDIFHIVS